VKLQRVANAFDAQSKWGGACVHVLVPFMLRLAG